MGCNAFQGQKWTTNLSKGSHQSFLLINKCIHDDYIVFNDLSVNLKKLQKCYLKCKEYGISLNLEKCAFMVYFRTIIGFIVSKEGKTNNPKTIEALVKIPVPKTLHEKLV